MPPLKRRRRAFIAPPSPEPDQTTPQQPPPTVDEVEPPSALPTIPADLLPEIAARSDFTTLVRCAACCKSLRAEILRPAFIRRVCRREPLAGGSASAAVPPFALGFLHAYDKARIMCADQDQDQPPPGPCFTAAHPATPDVASFFENHLAPFVARTAGKRLLGDYEPLTLRNGLVVLRRRYLPGGGDRRSSEMCVYDPMSGRRTFLPSPEIVRVRDRKASDYGVSYTYALLTAADSSEIGGGGGAFLVLAADFTGLERNHPYITVQTVSSAKAAAAGGGRYAWGPPTIVAAHPASRLCCLQPHCAAVVVRGFVHWLMYNDDPFFLFLNPEQDRFHVLTYGISTATAGSIELPKDGALPHGCKVSNLHLGSSPDGRLSLHVANRLKITVWLLPPAGAGDGWSQHAVIDIAKTAGSLAPPGMEYAPPSWWLKEVVEFASSGVRSGGILLRPFNKWFEENVAEEGEEELAVLDVETKELRRVIKRKHITVFPYEVDLEARLKAMKTF
ncbi:unnamed protein product [Urochloa humidicola]